jgi:hypothetical protein
MAAGAGDFSWLDEHIDHAVRHSKRDPDDHDLNPDPPKRFAFTVENIKGIDDNMLLDEADEDDADFADKLAHIGDPENIQNMQDHLHKWPLEDQKNACVIIVDYYKQLIAKGKDVEKSKKLAELYLDLYKATVKRMEQMKELE